MATPNLLGPALSAVLSAAYAGLDPKPARSHLQAGLPAWDCCENGILWVRVIDIAPHVGNAAPSNPCGILAWNLTLGIGVVRCAASLDEAGNPPQPGELTSEALQQTEDITALQRVLQCDLADVRGLRKVTIQRWTPTGPEGGCVGGEWRVTAMLDSCGC